MKTVTRRVCASSHREGNLMREVSGRLMPFSLSRSKLNICSVFETPWQSIVASCESLADAHETFAHKIAVDVERPLREYQSKNREMQGIGNVKGNLASVARDFDEAQKKADKLQAKGSRADTSKLSSALSGVQEASQLWESQAPFVFEQLQALDENRVDHLRDALTQYQTHEVDALERSQATAASSLEAILNVSTADEISSFVARASEGMPSLASHRGQSRPGTSRATPETLSAPVPLTPETPTTLMPHLPTPSMDDRRSEISSVSGGLRNPPPPATPGMLLKKCYFQGNLLTHFGREEEERVRRLEAARNSHALE